MLCFQIHFMYSVRYLWFLVLGRLGLYAGNNENSCQNLTRFRSIQSSTFPFSSKIIYQCKFMVDDNGIAKRIQICFIYSATYMYN